MLIARSAALVAVLIAAALPACSGSPAAPDEPDPGPEPEPGVISSLRAEINFEDLPEPIQDNLDGYLGDGAPRPGHKGQVGIGVRMLSGRKVGHILLMEETPGMAREPGDVLILVQNPESSHPSFVPMPWRDLELNPPRSGKKCYALDFNWGGAKIGPSWPDDREIDKVRVYVNGVRVTQLLANQESFGFRLTGGEGVADGDLVCNQAR